MSNLVPYNNNGLELFINEDDGSVWASVKACARMIDKHDIYVLNYEKTLIKGAKIFDSLQAEIQTGGGLQGAKILDENFIFELFKKYKPDLLIQCAKAGLRVYLYGLAGYEVKAAIKSSEVEVPPPLPPSDVRVINLMKALNFFGVDVENPRLKQGLQDITLNILGISQPVLSSSQEVWMGVAERAKELGYDAQTVIKNRSQLGKYVKGCGLNSRQEKRLCNGTLQSINIYEVTDELDTVIREFLNSR